MGEWTRSSMESGVAGADVIISVVSPKYIASKNCGFEMELAIKYKKTIIPIMLGVPFSEWPPRKIGDSAMTTQYKDGKSGDMKLFVDFTEGDNFETKFVKELVPRLEKGDPIVYIKRLLAFRPVARPCCKVMISYCWADTDFVLNFLAPSLARVVEGLWLDRLGGEEGMGEWTQASMGSGVSGSDVIISVVSPKYILSKNCGFEMELAAKHGKTIIPIMYNVPFSEWPPLKIGDTQMTTQYKDDSSGDMKLFVECTDHTVWGQKFDNELLPRLGADQTQVAPAVMPVKKEAAPTLAKEGKKEQKKKGGGRFRKLSAAVLQNVKRDNTNNPARSDPVLHQNPMYDSNATSMFEAAEMALRVAASELEEEVTLGFEGEYLDVEFS